MRMRESKDSSLGMKASKENKTSYSASAGIGIPQQRKQNVGSVDQMVEKKSLL